jgi:hypothetical protein
MIQVSPSLPLQITVPKQERVTSSLGLSQTRTITTVLKAPQQQIITFDNYGRQARFIQPELTHRIGNTHLVVNHSRSLWTADQRRRSPVDTKYSGGSVGLPGVPASCWHGKGSQIPKVRISKTVLAVLHRMGYMEAGAVQAHARLFKLDLAGLVPGR